MTTRNKQLAKLLIRIAITTALLIWVFRQEDIQQKFWETLKAARWSSLIAVWALTALYFFINSVKLQVILRKQSCDANVTTIFGASAVASLYGMIVPGILSTVAKWYILRKDTGKGSNVLSSMVYNQLSIMVVMTLFGLIALMVTNPMSLLLVDTKKAWLLPVLCGVLVAAIALVCLSLLSSRMADKITKALMLLVRPFPSGIRQKAQETLGQIAAFQSAGVRFHLNILCMTVIAGPGLAVLVYIFAARAANVNAPVGVLVWLCAIVYLLGRIPISVANLGVREVTLVGLLRIYGVEESAALLMSMILFSTSVLMAAIGAIYQLYWSISTKERVKPLTQQAP